IQERAAGGTLAYDIPIWVVELVLPVGFGAISARLLWHAGETWKRRMAALMVALTLGALMRFLPMPLEQMVWPALAGLFVATLLGAPVFVTLGGAALILFWGRNVPITAVAIEHYSLVTNPALPSIPLFTLAGYFMAEGGASRRLVRVFQALVGWIRGGPAIATALICAFFTALTGGSGVTILALGGLLMPVLVSARFSERDALGLITGAGSLGILLPPCLPVILYAIVAKVDIRDMFLGGLLPGGLLILMTAAWGIWAGRRTKVDRPKFDFAEARNAMWSAKWDLLLPVVSLVALFSGWATPVEAAAVTALYAFLVEAVIYRELKLTTDCPRVMTEAGLLVGGILLIMGVAMGLTNFMVDAQVPDLLANWAAEHIKSRWLFLLGLNVVLVLVGGLIEIYAAIMVITPLLVPVGLKLGIDPVHLGVIFLANMELGFLAPPIGLNLMLASSRLKRPVGEVTRAVLPLLAVMFIGVLLITYVPWFSNFLLKQPK
ncbi:MAG: TRAP transporter large permease subunit, partial [Verrucomicrobia bacterium]|nr:TRAP transporter large permease subunit [Verrucomicrobiota bacterium]